MPSKTIVVLFSALVVSGCEYMLEEEEELADGGEILRGGDVETLDVNYGNSSLDDNDRIEPGETTMPDVTFHPKGQCSQDVKLQWQACLFERDEWGYDWIGYTFDGRVMCGDFTTKLQCVDRRYEQGPTLCLGGYCDYVMEDTLPAICGWKITELVAYDETGAVLHWFTPEFIEGMGFHLLPVGY